MWKQPRAAKQQRPNEQTTDVPPGSRSTATRRTRTSWRFTKPDSQKNWKKNKSKMAKGNIDWFLAGLWVWARTSRWIHIIRTCKKETQIHGAHVIFNIAKEGLGIQEKKAKPFPSQPKRRGRKIKATRKDLKDLKMVFKKANHDEKVGLKELLN